MKRLNFNIKDRKVLTLGLCLILVCVFTLTIAYAALNAVLTIQGSAQVSSADWDIHLANPKVTNGSATTNVPQIKTNSTMDFTTTLNMPGDFYEFTVDVVNSGSIDAMINNVVKTPELTAEQLKYLKYEITYQNGESIEEKQLLEKNTIVPIKVRIEYRNDLVASDLPTTSTTLDLSLTLEYIQSDGSGSSIGGNVSGSVVIADGDINEIGTIVTIGSEQFYTIGTEGNNVKLLSMMNITIEDEPKQSESAGGTVFSSNSQKGSMPSDYVGSIVEGYVNNYKSVLETSLGGDIIEARLISYDELTDSKTFACKEMGVCSADYPWIYSIGYWTGTSYNPGSIWSICTGDITFYFSNYYVTGIGVRPVIVISKNYFN